MNFENTDVMNFEGAIRGMRNPMNSWHKSDSHYCDWTNEEDCKICDLVCPYGEQSGRMYIIGDNDLDLAQRLINAGPEHCKFLRQIFVSVDITAPLYFFKEFDTYKIGTTANSTSTMHKLASTPITWSSELFEMDDYDENGLPDGLTEYSYEYSSEDEVATLICQYIDMLETMRQKYLETKDKRYWKELIRWLPESWLQTRTVTMSYANLRNIYFQRKGHKLTEWKQFLDWIESLPYADKFITLKKD